MRTKSFDLPSRFRAQYTHALDALCAAADRRMVADPADCRNTRIEAEQAIAALLATLAPNPAWTADEMQAFEDWCADLIAQTSTRRH